MKMKKFALVAIASFAMLMAILFPLVSASESRYLPADYYHVGQMTTAEIGVPTYGVYAGIEVCDPEIDHTITTEPYTFFMAWIGVADSLGYPALSVGWVEADQWPTNTYFAPSVPGDKQYIFVENTRWGGWIIYPEYEICKGWRIFVSIFHIGDGWWAAHLSWWEGGPHLVRLPYSEIYLGDVFPNNQADQTEVYAEVCIGDASGQIPGCPSGYGYVPEVRNTQTYHHGTRFWPIWIKTYDTPEHWEPGGPGWTTWTRDFPTILREHAGYIPGVGWVYYGEWLKPHPEFPWVKYDTRYHSWIFYTNDAL